MSVRNINFLLDITTYQLLTVVVSLYNALIRDAYRHNQNIGDAVGTEYVNHNWEHARMCWRRLPTARACAL